MQFKHVWRVLVFSVTRYRQIFLNNSFDNIKSAQLVHKYLKIKCVISKHISRNSFLAVKLTLHYYHYFFFVINEISNWPLHYIKYYINCGHLCHTTTITTKTSIVLISLPLSSLCTADRASRSFLTFFAAFVLCMQQTLGGYLMFYRDAKVSNPLRHQCAS